MFKFNTRIRSGEMPMYLGLPVIPVALPRGDVASHGYQIGNSSIQTLPIQGAKLDFRHIEPTAMLRRIMDFEAFCQPPGFLRGKHLVEGSNAMGVQVVHDQTYLDSVWVAFVEHTFDPPRPVFSRSMLGSRHVAFTGQRFHFKKDLGTPLRTYSWSTRAGLPGAQAIASCTSPISCLQVSSMQITG